MASFKKKGICLEDAYTYIANEKKSLTPIINEFYTLRSEINEQKTLLARFDGNKFISLNYSKLQPFGVKPKNLGQYFLQEALMETAKKAPLVIIKGTAGTAK
ncbi:MAG TPA: ribonuclease, partial [Clostridium sp.]|nr:ribonuclease [Clostridium sp.]